MHHNTLGNSFVQIQLAILLCHVLHKMLLTVTTLSNTVKNVAGLPGASFLQVPENLCLKTKRCLHLKLLIRREPCLFKNMAIKLNSVVIRFEILQDMFISGVLRLSSNFLLHQNCGARCRKKCPVLVDAILGNTVMFLNCVCV